MDNSSMLLKVSQEQFKNKFIMTVDTSLGDGLNQMRLPIQGTGMVIDWGDGIVETVTQAVIPGVGNWVTHSYSSAFNGDIKISNTLEYVRFNNEGDKDKLTDIKQWGSAQWIALQDMCHGCSNLTGTATDTPDFSALLNSSFLNAFRNCTLFNMDVSNWNMVNVSNLRLAFLNNSSFNPNIESWNVINIINFENSFQFTLLDNNLSNWNIVNVTNFLSFLRFGGMSTANYDATLIGWETTLQSAFPSGVGYTPTISIDFGSSKYTLGSAAETARISLINNFGWTINDGGGI